MQKGFTLIELLAVIVILAIIALIATPIVLTIIDDSKESSTIRSAEGYLRAAEYEIARAYVTANRITEGTYYVLSDGNVCVDGYSNKSCAGNILEINYNNEGPIGGFITLEEAEIVHYQLIYPSNIVVVNGKVLKEGNVEKICKITLDENNNGVADTGDMIMCLNESFYVINNDGTTISMLAKYNLNVGDNKYPNENTYGLQDENVNGFNEGANGIYGIVQFSDTIYWIDYENDNNNLYDSDELGYHFIYGNYKDSDGNYLNNLFQYIDNYQNYFVSNGVSSATGTLISVAQLESLGCSIDGYCDNWEADNSYWIGSAYADSLFYFSKYENGYLGSTAGYSDMFGIRPVINVSTSEL